MNDKKKKNENILLSPPLYVLTDFSSLSTQFITTPLSRSILHRCPRHLVPLASASIARFASLLHLFARSPCLLSAPFLTVFPSPLRSRSFVGAQPNCSTSMQFLNRYDFSFQSSPFLNGANRQQALSCPQVTTLEKRETVKSNERS